VAVVPVQVAVQQPDAVGGGERAECQAADQRAERGAAESSAPNWSALAKYRTARITTGGQIVPVTTTTAAKPTPIPTNIRTQTPTMTASRPPAKFNTADAARTRLSDTSRRTGRMREARRGWSRGQQCLQHHSADGGLLARP
jgi:hypothetical protein